MCLKGFFERKNIFIIHCMYKNSDGSRNFFRGGSVCFPHRATNPLIVLILKFFIYKISQDIYLHVYAILVINQYI